MLAKILKEVVMDFKIKVKQNKISTGLLLFFAIILVCGGFISTLFPDKEVDVWLDNARNPVNFGLLFRVLCFLGTVILSLYLIYKYAKEKTENYWIPKMGSDLIEIPEEEPFKVQLQAIEEEGLHFRAEFATSGIGTKNFFIKERFLDPLTKKPLEALPENTPIWVKYRVKYEIKDAGDDHESVIPENVYFVNKDQNPKLQDEETT